MARIIPDSHMVSTQQSEMVAQIGGDLQVVQSHHNQAVFRGNHSWQHVQQSSNIVTLDVQEIHIWALESSNWAKRTQMAAAGSRSSSGRATVPLASWSSILAQQSTGVLQVTVWWVPDILDALAFYQDETGQSVEVPNYTKYLTVEQANISWEKNETEWESY